MKSGPPQALYRLICIGSVLLSEVGIVQPDPLVTAELGDDVTLQCLYPKVGTSYLSWYKQTVGKKPQLISTLYKHIQNATFHNEFKDDPRFTVQRGERANHLTISKTVPSDSAMYYCGGANLYTVNFGEGTFLSLTGSKVNSRTVVQQPVSEPVQPGDSVTLQCTIDTETCAGEHSVYWFRQGSGESSPGVIYTHGNRNDQCERSSGAGSPTQSCVYKLPKRNLSLSDAGTYYCAVATCGEILFGNGTKLKLEVPDHHSNIWQYIVLVLVVTLMVSLTTNLILFLMWTRTKGVPSALTQTEGIVQPDLLVTAELGDDVTLQCFYPKEESSFIAWYKQTAGKKPQLISSCYTSDKNAIFYNEFKDNPRFRVQSGLTWINLTISKTQTSDSASYYCGKAVFNNIEFAEGTFLMLKASELKSRTVVQQPVSEPVQPGDSVTLQCTIDAETCAGEHSVYWFRQGSGESSPGVIYTHGNSSDQCERSSGAGSPTQSCVYKLPKRNFSLSDSGTYYCAVATCGEILFGNGTKLDLGALTQTEGIVQPDRLVTAELGDDVTLQCFYPEEESSFIAWYKQTAGKKPQLISSCYTSDKNAIFYNEFKDNPRFRVQSGLTWISLTISKTQTSDSASYYCGKAVFNNIEFAEGTFLMLKGSESNSRTVVQQPVSEPVQPGDSVTLQCTIDTETCAGEHSVYWFRQGSGESSPGIIYTHGNRSDQCERSSGAGSPTQSCVYKLPKRNLSLFDAGTYYCAVATCGEILFGNGTEMDFERSHLGTSASPAAQFCHQPQTPPLYKAHGNLPHLSTSGRMQLTKE
ncbi:uncharacterized protein LOC118790674 [Megalops cyprinoides]|uniref:uncharacterized protein LOC118790674 n=1 Tax=Megalops cyprinoides TaxID=118141 RepID=UPI001864692A|nr:uncharacterized protein LOC118790674 [Megalops cyprinoides]